MCVCVDEHFAVRRVRFNEVRKVLEKVPKVPEKVWEALFGAEPGQVQQGSGEGSAARFRKICENVAGVGDTTKAYCAIGGLFRNKYRNHMGIIPRPRDRNPAVTAGNFNQSSWLHSWGIEVFQHMSRFCFKPVLCHLGSHRDLLLWTGFRRQLVRRGGMHGQQLGTATFG